jgi:hypothetical protein
MRRRGNFRGFLYHHPHHTTKKRGREEVEGAVVRK